MKSKLVQAARRRRWMASRSYACAASTSLANRPRYLRRPRPLRRSRCQDSANASAPQLPGLPARPSPRCKHCMLGVLYPISRRAVHP